MTRLSCITNYIVSALLFAGFIPVSGIAQELPSSADVGRVEPLPQRVVIPDVSPAPLSAPSLPLTVPLPEGANTIRFVLNNMTVEGVSAFSKDEIQTMYQEHVNEEINVTNLWEIAGRITQLYRNQGYFLSRAYVPAQQIDDGYVTIHVVEGHIADIRLNSDVSDHRLLAQYQQQMLAQRPLSASALESFMLALNSLPGQTFRAVIEPHTDQNGAVTLSLQESEVSYDASASIDNYGSRFLGPYQATLSYSDSLIPLQQTTLTAFTSLPFDELNYVAFRHEIPFYPQWMAYVSGNYVTSEPGASLAVNDIQSDSVGLTLGTTWQPIQQWDENLSFTLELDGMNTNGDILDNNPLTRDRIRNLRLRTNYDVSDGWNGRNFFSAQLNKGLGIFGGSDAGDLNLSRAEGEPGAFSLQLDTTRQQVISLDWLAIISLSGQVASDPLLSAEEFGFGGQRFGRAYDPSEITGDHGLAGSLEVRYTGMAPDKGMQFIPYGFYDHGAVWNKDTGAERESASSAGGGVYLSHASGVSGTLGIAFPLTRDIENPICGHSRNPRVIMQIGYKF